MFITNVLVNNVNGTQQLQNQNTIDGKPFLKKLYQETIHDFIMFY